MRPLLLAATALCLAATPGMARDRGAVPAARPAGKSVTCVPIPQIRSSHVRSDQVIDFEMRGGKVYRNTLPQSCPRLGFEQRFSYTTPLSQLCSSDIIYVLQQTPSLQRGAGCGLGQFQPVTLEKEPRRASNRR